MRDGDGPAGRLSAQIKGMNIPIQFRRTAARGLSDGALPARRAAPAHCLEHRFPQVLAMQWHASC